LHGASYTAVKHHVGSTIFETVSDSIAYEYRHTQALAHVHTKKSVQGKYSMTAPLYNIAHLVTLQASESH